MLFLKDDHLPEWEWACSSQPCSRADQFPPCRRWGWSLPQVYPAFPSPRPGHCFPLSLLSQPFPRQILLFPPRTAIPDPAQGVENLGGPFHCQQAQPGAGKEQLSREHGHRSSCAPPTTLILTDTRGMNPGHQEAGAEQPLGSQLCQAREAGAPGTGTVRRWRRTGKFNTEENEESLEHW